jgi:hypothetical protein
VIPAERDLFGPFFLSDDYLFAIDCQGDPTGERQAALLYVDLCDVLHTGQHVWKQIDYPPRSIAITQVFSIQEEMTTTATTVLRFISLETGGIHPLAKRVDIPLEL